MNSQQILSNILSNPTILLALIVIIIFGLFPPKKINSWYGYRTINSQKSEKNWHFSQHYAFKIFLPFISVLFLLQITLSVLVEDSIFIDFGIIALLILGSAICIYIIEKKLKKIV